MKKLILNLILTTFSLHSISAQFTKTIPEMTPPNPEAASLGSYGEVPMNMYTGTANIVVPLYTYDFDGLAVPINLSYNTSGIRTNQEATWVGLGWTLSSEPVITVQNKGLADILSWNYGGLYSIGFPYTDIPIQDYGGGYGSWTPELAEMYDLYHVSDSRYFGWDTEPDVFTINIFGETASFILTQKALNNSVIGTKMINPDSRFKVEFIESNKSFMVTNDKGFKFQFDKKEYAATVSSDPQGNYSISPVHTYSMITSWKLSKIYSPTNKTLDFVYYNEVTTQSQIQKHTSQLAAACEWNYPDEFTVHPKYSNIINGFKVFYLKEIKNNDISILFNTSQRLDISWIGDPQSQVAFWANTMGMTAERPKKMDELIIKNSFGQTTHQYQLNYTYFNQHLENDPQPKRKLRLKLDDIVLNNELYRSFSYINPNALSDKESRIDDYWGFYNGINNNNKSYPSYKTTYRCPNLSPGGGYYYDKVHIEGGNRLPNFNFGKNGLLETITYPTKGYTKLNYEPHQVLVNKDNRITEHPFEEYEDLTITSIYESIPATSQTFHLRHDITQEGFSAYEAKLKIASGFNTFDSSPMSHYLQYVPDWQSIQKTAFEMINAQTHQVVKKYIFSDDPNCHYTGPFGCASLTLPANSNTKTLGINFSDVPEGNYYFRVKGLHEPGNSYDQEEGCNNSSTCPDYGKQYQFSVRFELKVPKSFTTNGYNREIGGARIKSIENYDNNQQILSKKEYNYSFGNDSPNSGLSSGILIDRLNFHHDMMIGLNGYVLINGGTRELEIEAFSESIWHSPSKNYIGYSRVEEKNVDNLNQNVGKKISTFYNKSNSYDNVLDMIGSIILGNDPEYPGQYIDSTMAIFPKYSYHDINGKLSSEEIYDQNSDKLLQTDYDYNYDYFDLPHIARDNAIGNGMKQSMSKLYMFEATDNPPMRIFSHIRGEAHIMQIYRFLNESLPLITKTQTEYFNGIPLVSEVSYEYNGQYLPSRVSTTNSLGENLRTEYKYPTDLTSSYEQSALMNKLVGRNQIAAPVITKNIENGTTTLEERTHYAHFYESNSNPEAGFILPQYVYAKRGEIGTTSTLADRKITYDYYDNKGNLTQYSLENGTPVSIIWGYNGKHPIAKVEGVSYAELQSILDPDNTSNKLINAIQSKSEADNDRCTGEQWNSSCTEAQLRFKLNQLRFHTFFSTKPALITTYTYDPLVGVTSITPSNGQVEYYDYDLSGRLIHIKDNNGNILKKMDYHYKH